VTIGIFTFNVQGIQGALFQMLSHGVVSAALFLVVGVVYERMHTHEIARFNGLADRMPLYSFVFMIFMMATMGLPGTSGFVGEFLVIIGAIQVNFWLALLGATGMILGAAYMLYLYRRVIFGRLTKEDLRGILDLSPREVAIFVPLILITLWMGIYPSSFTGFWDASVASMVQRHTAAIEVPVKAAAASTSLLPVGVQDVDGRATHRVKPGGDGPLGHDDGARAAFARDDRAGAHL
jgi:NADH-quinone oxidoreductase subunit M